MVTSAEVNSPPGRTLDRSPAGAGDPSVAIGRPRHAVAGEVGDHPEVAVGEGPPEAAARFRVERAARMLRETQEEPALIAASAGFCDQSHMIRTFRRVLGRLPSAVRADQPYTRGVGP